ncbi:MAG: 30S ribosomal protein S7 [Treponema sp.]|jgi:small subunit ribosomal protein S7|nr:30S ribosomal protein S7 [Treponema sp.]
MGRKKKSIDRGVAPDAKYNSVVVSKFVNRMMWEGKRSVGTKLINNAFEEIRKKTGEEPLDIFLKAIDNVKPRLEVKSRRVGGATYQVPVEIRESRREALAMRWIIKAARSRNGRGMGERLAVELLDAFNKTGAAIKKSEDTFKMAEANKAFAHYRW